MTTPTTPSGIPLTRSTQAFPTLDTPFVDPETGFLHMVWYRLLAFMWQSLNSKVSDTQTATGNRQGTALPLGGDWNFFTTVAPGTGAALQQLPIGSAIKVWNLGANVLSVYPPVGWQIDSLGVNNPYLLPVGKFQQFHVRVVTKQFQSIQLG